MKKMYLISWCDDNHDPVYWLNTQLLGIDMVTIAETLFIMGQAQALETVDFQEIALTGDSFPEDIWEELFDFFQTTPTLDETDVRLIVEDKWQELFDKRVKK